MSAPEAQFQVDGDTTVRFELNQNQAFRPAGIEDVVGRLDEAVAPVVAGAQLVLEKLRQLSPDEVHLKFGIRVSGTMNWLIAKAASEGNFEVTLVWRAGQGQDPEE